MAPNEVALLLMAGGRSNRFGDADKLLTELNGQPLGLHAAGCLAPLPWLRKIAVTRVLHTELQALGYEIVAPAEDNGLGDNISLAARHLPPVTTLITLADMPFVTVEHIDAMLAAAETERAIVCTRGEHATTPPTLIGRAHFHYLLGLSGDEGARSVVRGAAADLVTIAAEETLIADIDTPADLEKWRGG